MEAHRRWKQHEAAIANIHGFREQLQISKSYQTNASNWMHCQKHGCCNCTLLPRCPDVKLVPSLQEPSLETNATYQTETWQKRLLKWKTLEQELPCYRIPKPLWQKMLPSFSSRCITGIWIALHGVWREGPWAATPKWQRFIRCTRKGTSTARPWLLMEKKRKNRSNTTLNLPQSSKRQELDALRIAGSTLSGTGCKWQDLFTLASLAVNCPS